MKKIYLLLLFCLKITYTLKEEGNMGEEQINHTEKRKINNDGSRRERRIMRRKLTIRNNQFKLPSPFQKTNLNKIICLRKRESNPEGALNIQKAMNTIIGSGKRPPSKKRKLTQLKELFEIFNPEKIEMLRTIEKQINSPDQSKIEYEPIIEKIQESINTEEEKLQNELANLNLSEKIENSEPHINS